MSRLPGTDIMNRPHPRQPPSQLRRRRGATPAADRRRCYRLRPAAVFVLFLSCLAAAAGPRIAVSPNELDMGRIKPGAHSERQLTLANTGDAPLVIEGIMTSCPCATLSPLPAAAATLAPGESLQLTVRYEAGEDPAGSGAAIVIHSNDPNLPVVVTDLRFVVDVLVAVSPPDGIFWGFAPRGLPLSKELILAPGDVGKDIELLDVTASVPGITITSEMAEGPDVRFIRLNFGLATDVPLGTLDAVIRVRVRVGEEVARLSVPFRGEVLGDLDLSPPAIIKTRIARMQGEKISEVTVSSATGAKPPDIVGVMARGPITAVIERNADAEGNMIGIYVAENAPGGPQSATVYVMTTSKDEPIVAVPVYFRVDPPVVCEPGQPVLHATDGPREIRLRHRHGGQVRVTGLRYEPDSLWAEILVPIQEDADRPAIVSVRPAAAVTPKKRGTLLVIQTDVPGAEQIAVPMMVLP
jgi:hypothetical protein